MISFVCSSRSSSAYIAHSRVCAAARSRMSRWLMSSLSYAPVLMTSEFTFG
jgi:hypothetical protein